jgi:adenylate cyclase
MLDLLQNTLSLLQARLSRYIVAWVFTSIVVVEIGVLVPSFFRRQDELLSKLENVSLEVFASLIYQKHSEEERQKIFLETTQRLKPDSSITGAFLYQANGKMLSQFGEKPDIYYTTLQQRGMVQSEEENNPFPFLVSPLFRENIGKAKILRLRNQDGTRYDIAWSPAMLEGKYVLIVRHNSSAIKGELYSFAFRVAGLVFVISIFVTLTTMLTLGVTVISPILHLRDDLVVAGEAIAEDRETPNFSTLSIQRQDEMGEVILAFKEMFQRVRQEISDRQQAEASLRNEQEKSEALLLNILPAEIAQQLKQEQSAIAQRFDNVTIMFADIVNFTNIAAEISPIELVSSLNQIFSTFDRLAQKYGVEKIKTIGDAYMVVGGLPTPSDNHAWAIAKMALEMQQAICELQVSTGKNFQLRIGINTGSVVAGVIGLKKFSYDLWGDAVNLASRMESHGAVGKIQVSEATYMVLKEQFQFEKRGVIQVKGRGEVVTYFLLGMARG